MPTYDYECKKCKHVFEELQSIKAKVLKTCPKCGKRSLERLIGSGAGLIFKGSGFYITDYCRPQPTASNKSEENKSLTEKSKKNNSSNNSSKKDGQKNKKS